ncbi:hypothetical protein ACFX2J_018241 [Malus domestica]
MVEGDKGSRPAMANDDHEVENRHDEDEVRVGTKTASARSYMRHVLFDLDSSGNELEDLRRNILNFQEPAALYPALQAQEVIAAQGMPEQQQQELGLASYAALQAQEAVQGMPEKQELGLGWSYGNYVPPDLLPPIPSLRGSIQFQEHDAHHVLQAKKVIATQGIPKQPPERGPGSYCEIQNSVLNDASSFLSFKHSIQLQEPAAPQAQQSQKAIAAEKNVNYKIVNYVPSYIPSVPSIQHLIQICSKPFEKQLMQNDVTRDLRLKDCDVETHILSLLKPSEDLKQCIWITAYDIAGNMYKMIFKAIKIVMPLPV